MLAEMEPNQHIRSYETDKERQQELNIEKKVVEILNTAKTQPTI